MDREEVMDRRIWKIQEDMGNFWLDVGPVFASYEEAVKWATAPGAGWIRPYRIVDVSKSQ